MEFDVLDTEQGALLSTPRRLALLAGLPLVSVPVIHAGPLASPSRLASLIGPSRFIQTGHLARLQRACADQGLDPAQVLRETDPSVDMEGLYIKVEEGGAVVERYKYIRAGFLTSVLNAGSHFAYFRKQHADPDYAAYDDTQCDVVLMSGLPGAGKDHWIAAHRAEWPVVSLDTLRAELRIAPHEPQGAVIDAARRRAREHLRAGRSFVWNATNITRMLRERLIDLFAGYRARIAIVYLDAPYGELVRRNDARAAAVPQAVLARLADVLEVPDLTEAHQVQWIVSV